MLSRFSLLMYDARTQIFMQFLFFIALMLMCETSLANSGTDILAGTETSLKATLTGTGKKYFYLVDAILGLAVYIKTKNILLLFGSFIVIAIFFEILLKFI